MTTANVVMPQLGESVVEGTVVRWLVKPGQRVARDEPLVEVATDKANTEIPSPGPGVVMELLAAEGAIVPVGGLLVRLDDAPSAQAGVPAAANPAATTALFAAPQPAPSAVRAGPVAAAVEASPVARAMAQEHGLDLAAIAGSGAGGKVTKVDVQGALGERSPALSPAAEPTAVPFAPLASAPPPAAASLGAAPGAAPAAASPYSAAPVPVYLTAPATGGPPPGARGAQAAAELPVPVNSFVGSPAVAPFSPAIGRAAAGPFAGAPAAAVSGGAFGSNGPASQANAPASLAAPAVPAPGPGAAPAAPPVALHLRAYKPQRYALKEGDQAVPFDQRRRLIAEHMVYSKVTSPHVPCTAEVDMSNLARLREEWKKAKETGGKAPSFLVGICRATVQALGEFPRLNAIVQDDALILRRDVNLGVAVETEKGLLVPVIRRASEKSVLGLGRALDDLAERGRAGKLTADEMSGGSFTVSNPGLKGNLFGAAVINQPQVGILRMGEIVKRPVVRTLEGQDAIVIRPMMYLTLSYDHRVIDGVTGNGFLFRVRELIETAKFEL